MAQFADVQIISVVPSQLYRIVINGANHDHTTGLTPTATTIRDALITAVNTGGQPVTAFATDSDRLLIKANVVTVEHTYSVNSALLMLLTVGEEAVFSRPTNKVATRIGGGTTHNVHAAVKNKSRRERDADGTVYEQ